VVLLDRHCSVASVCLTGQPRAQHQFIDEFHGQQAASSPTRVCGADFPSIRPLRGPKQL
jgi:hypothetical protein